MSGAYAAMMARLDAMQAERATWLAQFPAHVQRHLLDEEARKRRRRRDRLLDEAARLPVLVSVFEFAADSGDRMFEVILADPRGPLCLLINLRPPELLDYERFRLRCMVKLGVLYSPAPSDWWFYQVLLATCRTAAEQAGHFDNSAYIKD